MHISKFVIIATVALVFGAAAAPTSHLVAREAALNAHSYTQCTSNAKREATIEKREAALNACRFEAAEEKREAEPESLEALMEKRDAALDAANSYSQIICARNPALNACKYAAAEKAKREAAAHNE
ncbi:hypothetical protein MMC18_000781 [Xylographa bjoerkii]|nr:hypothetical protein [Xylographa bjoerkii]